MDTEAATDLFRREPDRHLEITDPRPTTSTALSASSGVSESAPAGGEVAYRRVGSGPDVLFVHGWPVSGATFRQLLPHLVDHVTCHLIDLPGAGSSRYSADTDLSFDNHIRSVQRCVELLDLNDLAVVGHNSGGLIARRAMVGDDRLRAMALINTEQTRLSRRFRSFIAGRHLPGFGPALGWLVDKPRLRRNRFVLGDAFADSSLLDGEFDEFFLQPLATDTAALDAAMKILRSFGTRYVSDLADIHAKIDVPVRLIWGDQDPFFPVSWCREMVDGFPDADLTVIPGAGLFSHEERPAAVAKALLPTLTV